MPKGVYERKPRKMSEAGIAALRKNMAKAREAARTAHNKPDSPAATAAKRRNAGKAAAIRTARAVLKHLPVGAAAGTVFQATRYRKLTVIDAAPVSCGDIWEQKFHQSGRIVIYGSTHAFDNDCRIVWNYRPTLENIMDAPMFEETGEPRRETGEPRRETGEPRRENRDGRRENRDGRRESRDGRTETGDGRAETGEPRRERGDDEKE